MLCLPLLLASAAIQADTDPQSHDHDAMPGMMMPSKPASSALPEQSAAPGGDEHMDHSHSAMTMPAARGPYAMSREASGTSWQPDASPHMGAHAMAGRWTLMGHAQFNLAYSAQGGPRGDHLLFPSGMVMGMATGALDDRNTVQFRAMLSPDPIMGRRGYPLLLAAGETADGVTTLVDRQHPHDLFMELSASYSRRIGTDASLFLYAGLPGEPAFGPPAFMHRLSIMDSPEAPITHHWLDSTHITFGVATAGITWRGIKLEASRFKGREPDERRWNLETPKLDSTAVRVSLNPSAEWALQTSWARQHFPEELDPEDDQEKLSASAIWTRRLSRTGHVAATVAWGRRITIAPDGHRDPALDAFALEASATPDRRWTAFGRAELVETDELLPAPGRIHGPIFTVGKASLGVIRDFRIATDAVFGIGGIVARSIVPRGLDGSYGGDRTSGMGFVRLKIG